MEVDTTARSSADGAEETVHGPVDIQAWKDRKRRFNPITIDSDSEDESQTQVNISVFVC